MVQAYRGPPGAGDLLGLYDYNHEGMRIRHRFGDRGDVDTYYDGGAVLEERRPDTGLLLARYRYGNRLISLDTGTDKRFYHTDVLGSTIGLTDLAGQVDTSYLLDPWGQVLEQTGDSLNRQIFTGQEHDEKTGLIYFGARYYDPDTGRFTTQDSYLGEIGTPPSLHRYLYAYGNPTVYVDEDGHSATVTGAVTGFFWGFGQMIGGMANDLYHGNCRSTYQYLGVWGQNIIGGAEMGASIDIAFLSGGTAVIAGSGALGAAGFDALTFEGRPEENVGSFAESQLHNAAAGAVLGPVMAKAAPVAAGVVAKIPAARSVLAFGQKYGEKGAAWVAQKASALDSTVIADIAASPTIRVAQQAAFKVSAPFRSPVRGGNLVPKPTDPYSPEWNLWYKQNPNHPEARFRSAGAAGNAPKRLPHGFSSLDDFTSFINITNKGLGKAGYKDAVASLQGSAVTGRSFNTGNAFGSHSDFDIAIASESLFKKAMKRGLEIGKNPSRIGPLMEKDIKVLGLRKLQSKLINLAGGREVNFMLFKNQDKVLRWSADTIPLK